MAIQRHELDQLMMSLFDKELTFKAGPSGWTGSSACSMLEFDDASAHEVWDDRIFNDGDLVGFEFPRKQQITRQSVSINYTEPRCKPNSLAGLMGLGLGNITSDQDGAFNAWRHKVIPEARNAMPSIGVQTKHDGGRQYRYLGVKSNGFTLAGTDDFLSLSSPLMGSGNRATAGDAFAAAILEDSLLWADGKIFVKATAGTPITIPATPTQGAANLGGSEVELSSRITEFSFTWANSLAGDAGYRLGQGKERANLHPARRNTGTVLNLGIEVDDATEATELDYYINQTDLAFELNIDSGTLIDAGGAFKFGLIFIIPKMRFRTVARSSGDGDREILTFEGSVLNDQTNNVVVGFVYNGQAAYLV